MGGIARVYGATGGAPTMNVRNETMPKMTAGLDRDEGKHEVEITPEMTEAGSAVLCRMRLDLADEDFWAEEVYRAMAVLMPPSSSQRVAS